MNTTEKITQLAEKNMNRAREVVKKLDVEGVWRSIGAKVNLVGSLKTGLLVKHRDIDFHIYTPELSISESFRAMAKIASNPMVQRVEYGNLIDTGEACIEWHAWCTDQDGATWQIDMIHILEGSQFDGFFENVAERIAAALTPETKSAIMRIKYDTPESEKIMGIEYYVAVLRDGVRSWPEFELWRANNPPAGIVLWVP